jgi:hypothetical protein
MPLSSVVGPLHWINAVGDRSDRDFLGKANEALLIGNRVSSLCGVERRDQPMPPQRGDKATAFVSLGSCLFFGQDCN